MEDKLEGQVEGLEENTAIVPDVKINRGCNSKGRKMNDSALSDYTGWVICIYGLLITRTDN